MLSPHATAFRMRLEPVAERAGVDMSDCTCPLSNFMQHVHGVSNLMAAAEERRNFYLDMRGRAHAQPQREHDLQALCTLMEEEFDYLVGWFTNRNIEEERQRVNWVNQAFMTSEFFPRHDWRGARSLPKSELIERGYYLWRGHTPNGQATWPVLREKRLYQAG